MEVFIWLPLKEAVFYNENIFQQSIRMLVYKFDQLNDASGVKVD